MQVNSYCNPLTDRYAGKAMSFVWSPQYKHSTWRRLWRTLATEESKLGLPITQEQIDEIAAHLDDIDFAREAEIEKVLFVFIVWLTFRFQPVVPFFPVGEKGICFFRCVLYLGQIEYVGYGQCMAV